MVPIQKRDDSPHRSVPETILAFVDTEPMQIRPFNGDSPLSRLTVLKAAAAAAGQPVQRRKLSTGSKERAAEVQGVVSTAVEGEGTAAQWEGPGVLEAMDQRLHRWAGSEAAEAGKKTGRSHRMRGAGRGIPTAPSISQGSRPSNRRTEDPEGSGPWEPGPGQSPLHRFSPHLYAG